MFYETVLFDVSNAVAGRRVFAAFSEPTWSWGGLVVVNLRGGDAVCGGVLSVVGCLRRGMRSW